MMTRKGKNKLFWFYICRKETNPRKRMYCTREWILGGERYDQFLFSRRRLLKRCTVVLFPVTHNWYKKKEYIWPGQLRNHFQKFYFMFLISMCIVRFCIPEYMRNGAKFNKRKFCTYRRQNHSASRAHLFCVHNVFLDYLTLEDETDTLSQHVDMVSPFLTFMGPCIVNVFFYV
jgi:hypothetical protein